ncbi:MAG: hypothetical protein LAO30_11865 [Acidobacteriia bacterium]|nr:hypothetical protein [Terriglobia bacterium]
MSTRRSSLLLWFAALLVGVAVPMTTPLAAGQALTPAEVKSPQMRALQEKYFQQLQAVAVEIQGHIFPYPFYFSRVLDLEMAQQERADQRSLRFDNYGGMTVVELTANYFGSYSVELVNKSHRAVRTFNDVMLPVLEIAVNGLKDNPDVEGFAMEISHRIRGKAMGMNMEKAENLVLVLPKQAATKLVEAKNENDRQAAVLEGQFFYNGEPFLLYLSDQAAAEAAKQLDKGDANSPASKEAVTTKSSAGGSRSAPRVSAPVAPPRDTSPEALAKIQAAYEKIIGVIVRETDPQAHFVSYAPPTMVAFRKGAYLEFAVTTPLPASASGSRYKMAALAFDDHIAHLVRPMMAYLKGDLDFDGIAFSTAIHLPETHESPSAQKPGNMPQDKPKGKLQGKSQDEPQDRQPPKQPDPANDTQSDGAQGSEAVEFFFPVEALRCYETYDCTGQQLLDGGSVLINGERVSLDLQIAEAGVR